MFSRSELDELGELEEAVAPVQLSPVSDGQSVRPQQRLSSHDASPNS